MTASARSPSNCGMYRNGAAPFAGGEKELLERSTMVNCDRCQPLWTYRPTVITSASNARASERIRKGSGFRTFH